MSGHDCIKDIVNGSTGDLCPYCTVKLFKANPTTVDVLNPITRAPMHGLFAYYDMVVGVKMQIDDLISVHSNEYHPLPNGCSGLGWPCAGG